VRLKLPGRFKAYTLKGYHIYGSLERESGISEAVRITVDRRLCE
jgi:hypothetical protein